MSDDNTLLRDEQGNQSFARVALAIWLVQMIVYIYTCLMMGIEPSNVVMATDTSVALALCTWAAGARIAQYIGPQIASGGAAIAQAIRAQIAKRRDPKEGIESTP